MESLFLSLWNRSVAAGWLILAVIVLRLALKKAPKSARCLLWGLVGLRLLCPFSIQSALSLLPGAETIPQTFEHVSPQSGYYLGNPTYVDTVQPVRDSWSITSVCAVIWLAGMILLALWALVSWWRLRRSLAEAVPEGDGVWLCDRIDSPFLLGLFRPRIYLPFGLDEDSKACVLAHERAHIQRRDHWIKPLAYLLLTVYWFQPLVWAAYLLLCRDIELACDERVVKTLGAEGKRTYSQALLQCSIHRSAVAACPLAFGEVGVKERVKNVLNYKKPAFWAVAAAALACVILAVCFLTDPLGFRLDLEKNPIVAAQVLDFRFTPDPREAELTNNQIDELTSRLESVKSSPSREYDGFTPLYQMSVQLQDGTELTANGYSADGNYVGITVGEKSYKVDSANQFAEYLSHICSGGDIGPVAMDGPVYTGGALLYEQMALNYLPADGSYYQQVQETGGRLEITYSDGGTFSGELKDQAVWEPFVMRMFFDEYAQDSGTAGRLCPEDGGTIDRRVYQDGEQLLTVYHLADGQVWLGEGGPVDFFRLYELIDPAKAFPNPSTLGLPWILWTANGRSALPIRFEEAAEVSVNTGTLYRTRNAEKSGQKLSLYAGETVYWFPYGEDGTVPDNANLRYLLNDPSQAGKNTWGGKPGTLPAEEIKLRSVSKSVGDFGETYGLAIDWLGAFSSKLHTSGLSVDLETGILVVSTEPGDLTGVYRVGASETVGQMLRTEEATAE